MADSSVQETAWRRGYEAALRDVEQHVTRHHSGTEAVFLAGLLADLRAGLTAALPSNRLAADAAGIPAEELEREWTAG
jgi:hypothetical protein